jgi:hypothetical protein
VDSDKLGAAGNLTPKRVLVMMAYVLGAVQQRLQKQPVVVAHYDDYADALTLWALDDDCFVGEV